MRAGLAPVPVGILGVRRTSAGWGMWLARVTALVALAELALLRVGTRTAIHIPGMDRVAVLYTAMADAGRLGYYLAVVLLASALAVMVPVLHARGQTVAAVAVGVLLVAVAAGRAGWIGPTVLDVAVVAVIVGLAAGIAVRLPRAARLPAVLYAGSFAFALGGGGLATEVAAVGATVALAPWALRGADRFTLSVGAAVAAVTLGALVLSPATPRILLLWNAGLTGVLPGAVSAVGFGSLAVMIVRLWRSGNTAAAVGLALLVEAGTGFRSTYQSGLAVLGLLVLTLGLLDDGPTALLPGRPAGASSR